MDHDVRTALEADGIGWAMWDYHGDFGWCRTARKAPTARSGNGEGAGAEEVDSFLRVEGHAPPSPRIVFAG